MGAPLLYGVRLKSTLTAGSFHIWESQASQNHRGLVLVIHRWPSSRKRVSGNLKLRSMALPASLFIQTRAHGPTPMRSTYTHTLGCHQAVDLALIANSASMRSTASWAIGAFAPHMSPAGGFDD